MITVIDDFMPEEYFRQLQTFLLSLSFPWFHSHKISTGEDKPLGLVNAIDSSAFTHKVFGKWENHKTFTYEAFLPLVDKIENHLENTHELIRLRAVLTNYQHGFASHNYNLPHVDYPCKHISAVYYLNETDGDTWIFDQYYQGKTDPETYTVKQRVCPKPNRLLIFDGLQYHTASNPVMHNTRLIANLNFVQKGTDLDQERLKYINS
jgi:hypothetical protein